MKQRYIFICCFFMAANFTFAQCLQAPGGMLSWWTADGNTNDISGSNNGNLFNGASYAAGKVGQGFSFDGVDDYVQASAINLPTGNSNRTLMCWAKVNAIVTSEAFFAGYGSFGSFTQTYQIGTTTNNNLVFFSQWGQQIVGPTLQTGVWYHVAVSNTGNFTTLFLNGNVVATGNLNINTAIGTQFNIGRIPGSLGNYRRLNGMVDEVQVFDRALAQSEIQTIYNAGGAGVCKTCNITANAGPDTTIFSGQSVQIGSAPVAGNTYSWTPATGLSDANIANPLASPADSITYSLTVTNANGCSGTDEIQVIVLPVIPGSACLNPIPFTPTNTCNPIDFTMSGNEMWFSFVADNTKMRISILPSSVPFDTSLANIQTIGLYGGICGSMTLLQSINFRILQTDFINISDAIPGNTYFLRISKSSTDLSFFSMCLKAPTTITAPTCQTQNACDLIYNGNLEEYTDCPTGISQFTDIDGNNNTVNCWVQPTIGSADYYSGCGGLVPDNGAGCQMDISPDESYAGIFLGALCQGPPPAGGNYVEYIQQKMVSAMIPGIKYFLQMNISLAEITNSGYADGVEVYLSNDQITAENSNIFPVAASLKLTATELLNDESKWVKICGTYTAIGGEQWITIGNFGGIVFNSGLISSTGCSGYYSPPTCSLLYYYIDDVSVMPLVKSPVCSNSTIGSDCPLPGATYSWLPAAGLSCTTCSNPYANPATTTTYTLTVTYANGCSATADVTVYPFIVASVTSTGLCQGISQGTDAATATGGTTPYSYAWSNGATTSAISNLAAGTYSVTLTDANGCTGMGSVIISTYQSPKLTIQPNSTCDGNATAIASGGTLPYSYAWSNGQTGPTVTNLPAGTYTITVTDANGCTDEESLTTFPSPIVTITPSPICDGTATALPSGGTSPYYYLWNNGAYSQTASNLPPGNVSVTVTDANGCSAIANAISSEPPEAPEIQGINNNCGLSNIISVTNIDDPLSTYTWSTLSGASGSGSSYTWPSGFGNAGSITFTVTDQNGCTNQSTFQVNRCCIPEQPPGRIQLNNTNSSSFGQGFIDQFLVINGTFTVNNNFTFLNCDVAMGPDAKIVIQPNASLTCTTTTIATIPTKLYAGCGQMWDGIYLIDASSALLITSQSVNKPTTVQDAKNAVVTKNGGNYQISKSYFFNNLRCIIQENDAGSELIAGNYFVSFGPLLNFAPQAKSFAELTNVPDITIGATGQATNYFFRADVGIQAINSAVKIFNNHFHEFLTSSTGSSYAVLSYGNPGNNSSLTIGGNTASKNRFENCTYGIVAIFKQNVSIKTNEFVNVQNGIAVYYFTNNIRTIDIIANEMKSFKYGIDINDVPLCTLRVNSNKLYQNTSSNSFNKGIGIRVANPQPYKGQITKYPEIKSNIIAGSMGSYEAISLNNVVNAQVKLNQITLPHSNSLSSTIYGIRAMYCKGSVITDNLVKRNNFLPGIDVSTKLYGISIENTMNAKVGKNNIQKVGSGIHAKQTCTNTKFYCNTLYQNFNGFYFEQASISTQGAAGLPSDNVWTDLTGQPLSKRIRYAITNTCNTPPCVKWYHKSYPAGYNLIPNVNVSQYAGSSSISFNPTYGSGCGNNQSQVNFTPPEREENYGPIVRNEKQFSEFDNEFKHWEKELAYTALKDEGWHPLNAADDAVYQNFINGVEQTNIGKFREVKMAIEQNDIVLAETKNNSITPNNLIDENRKQVNNIYLKTLAVEQLEFDPTQQATLESIACQNPLEGGDAVYSARTMLGHESNCQPVARMANPTGNNDQFVSSNLIQNNSFEQYSSCPDENGQLNFVNHWFDPYSCTSDYFNVCGNSVTGTPNNFWGYQPPQDGNGYIALGLFSNSEFGGSGVRELAETELSEPLVAGKKYCVEFYVSLILNELYTAKYAISNIGCLFTADTFKIELCQILTSTQPQVENTQGLITDTVNWVKISSEFIAQGGERFLTIGNFHTDSNTTYLFLGDSSSLIGFAVYYFDNISVTLCDSNTSTESSLLKSKNDIEVFAEIYPNPNDGRMTLKYSLENSTDANLQIFDLKGTVRFGQKLNPEKNSIVLDNLALENGIFYYSITVDGKRTINKKLVVIR